MFKTNMPVFKLYLNISIFCSCLLVFYLIFYMNNGSVNPVMSRLSSNHSYVKKFKQPDFNVWLIFTKAERTPLQQKFHNLLENILNVSSVPLKFHIIVDNSSRELAIDEISSVVSHSNKAIYYKLYSIEECARIVDDIVRVMTPHFSSKPGTYYSDALFYISIGLYRIAPRSQTRALLLDCDLYFKQDIRIVFDEFNRFIPSALFGLAPELTPVYRHILQKYRSKHKNTTFGDFYHPSRVKNVPHSNGFPGYNSGLVLINLSAIRDSKEFQVLIRNETIQLLTEKYNFKGHLGDQDFYTLVGFEYPHLIQTLDCGFNRQLCTWWRDHGYKKIFNDYFKCDCKTVVFHGNCNTKIPKY